MTDGLEAQAIAILTAEWMREQGNANPPPFIASILRVDGEIIEMVFTNIYDVASLLQQFVPGLTPSTFRLLRGRDETTAQRELRDLMNARLKLH